MGFYPHGNLLQFNRVFDIVSESPAVVLSSSSVIFVLEPTLITLASDAEPNE